MYLYIGVFSVILVIFITAFYNKYTLGEKLRIVIIGL